VQAKLGDQPQNTMLFRRRRITRLPQNVD